MPPGRNDGDRRSRIASVAVAATAIVTFSQRSPREEVAHNPHLVAGSSLPCSVVRAKAHSSFFLGLKMLTVIGSSPLPSSFQCLPAALVTLI